MVIYISCNGRWLEFKVWVFFKIFISITLLQLFTTWESSEQLQLWYHFVFKVNFEEGLLPLKIFLSVASLQALTHPEVFFNEIWNIHLKVFFWNRCSKYFWEISTKTSVKELIFSKFLSFQHGLGCKWFSQKFSVQLLQRTQLAELYSFHLIIP